jgi:hypothetical protein
MSSYWDWLATRERRVTAPREPEMRSYSHSLSERLKYGLQDVFMWMGAKPYEAGRLAGSLRDVASLVPPIGIPLAAHDMQRAAERGDITDTAMAALGATPAGKLSGRAGRVAFATHEAVPGAGTGHLPGFVGAPDEVRVAYSADPRSTWATAPGGRDAIYAGMRSAETGRPLGVLPTLEMQGVYTAPGGLLELNPGWTGRPQLSAQSVRAQRLTDADRKMLDGGEAVRALTDGQQAGGYHVPWFYGPPGGAHSVHLGLHRKATPDELLSIEAAAQKVGLPNASDTGRGVTVTRYSPPPENLTPEMLNGQLIPEIRAAVPEVGAIRRTRVEGNSIDYSKEYTQPIGSGAATRKMLGYVNASPEIRAALNSNEYIPRKALGNLERDAEWATRLGATREDIQNLRRIIGHGPGWVDRLEEGLKKGAVLPALAGLVLGTDSDPASEP